MKPFLPIYRFSYLVQYNAANGYPEMSQSEVNWLCFVMYTVTLLFISLLALLVYNVAKYLIVKGAMRNLSMIFFYTLSISTVLLRIYFSIFAIPVFINDIIFVCLVGPILAAGVAFSFAWIMVELSLKVDQSQLQFEI